MNGFIVHRNVSSILDEFFNDDFWGLKKPMSSREFCPVLDVLSSSKGYIIRVDLPGLTKGDVTIKVEDGYLSLEGEKKQVKDEKDVQYHRVERGYGKFTRMFKLPTDIDTSSISAKMENGVLEVAIGKPEAKKPNVVDIKVN